MKTFRTLCTDPNPEQFIAEVLPWIYESGNPYFDWIFGSPESTRERLVLWMQRKSAEMSLSRVTLLFEEGQPVGGFLALGGAELARCRLVDAAALMKEGSSEERASLRLRMAAVQNLFPRVAAKEFFLSKLGVKPDLRGKGLGRDLVVEYLAAGRAAGFRRFRLNVWAEHKPAISLYTSLGFQVDHDAVSAEAGMHYFSMVRKLDTPEEEREVGIFPKSFLHKVRESS